MENNDFGWVPFYKEFSGKLLAYKDDRSSLVKKVKEIYERSGISMPTLDRPDLVDIDPFTVFGLFNKSSQKTSNRILILKQIKDLFDIASDIPNSFNSIPVLNNQNATYYYFIDERADNDIDDLWNLFVAAQNYTKESSSENREAVSKCFDIVINKKGNGNSKVTMGLYWIAPETFLNLDSRNEWYIYESGKIPERIVKQLPEVEPKISAAKYFDIVEIVSKYLQSGESSLKNYLELSYEAWKYSNEVNEQNKLINAQESKGSGLGDENINETHYWIYAPGNNASKWEEYSKKGLMGIGWSELGDLSSYTSRTEMQNKMKELYGADKSYKNDSLATWQFSNELKPGDIVYAKKGMNKIVGRGVVTSNYFYDDEVDGDYKNLRKIDWKNIGEWNHGYHKIVMKTLTDITQYTNYVDQLESMFVDEEGDISSDETKKWDEYNKQQFLKDVYISEKQYEILLDLLNRKKNIILQGAPGVGKTYAAKRLAYSIIGEKNPERVMMIQFHQSYSYEDFIEGYRPASDGDGFEIKKGSFYKFCKEAANDKEKLYFFIIDEINRGNLSKIFGELFMLIESDKRGNELQLLYSDEKFSVPENVYLIGLMNTADRSLALLDYALRRRFSFFEMKPAFDQPEFLNYANSFANNQKFLSLIDCVKSLNNLIKSDNALGEGFCIGHSYFCNLDSIDDKVLQNIVEYEIIPLIKEYWFDEPGKVAQWSASLRNSIE